MGRFRHPLRFEDRSVELAYRRWHHETSRQWVVVGLSMSAFGWVLVTAAMVLVDVIAGQDLIDTAVVVQDVVVVIVLLGALWLTRVARLRTQLGRMVALLNAGAGCLIVWHLPALTRLPDPHAAAVPAAIVVAFFGFTVFRIRPHLAALAVGSYVALELLQLQQLVATGGAAIEEVLGPVAALGVTYLSGLFVCAMIDWLARRSFEDETLISEQRVRLEVSQRAIRRFVPPRVADRLESGDAGSVLTPRRQRVTALFSDIVDFTDMADRLDPEDLTELVNDYMAYAAEVVDAHGGTVTEFIGDGVLALFGAPDELGREEQARRAVEAALALQRGMPALNERWRRLGLGRPAAIRVGINTGMASVGTFGDEGRATYTAIGLQVNVAGRLQSHCPPGDVLVSETTYQLATAAIAFTPFGPVDCKGVHYPVLTYRPVEDDQPRAATRAEIGS